METTDLKPKVVELILDSGELVYVKPLSIYLRSKIREESEKRFPDPEPTPYERPIDPELTAVPGEVVPAKDNPAYKLLLDAVKTERLIWWRERVALLACEFPAGKDALIKKYKGDVATYREFGTLPDDVWEATLFYAIITNPHEFEAIITASMSNMQLTEGEITAQWRIFRPYVPGSTARNYHRETDTPAVTQSQESLPT